MTMSDTPIDSPTRTSRYTVHVYREMRLVFTGIEASSLPAAASIACAKPMSEADDIQDADGRTLAALVDLDGDTEHLESRVIDTEDGRLLDLAPRLIEALHDFVALNNASSPDFWSDIDPLFDRARVLLRMAKGRGA